MILTEKKCASIYYIWIKHNGDKCYCTWLV